jgi:hypothetical protein
MEQVVTVSTDDGWTATYHGGPYIEVTYSGYPGAVDCVNVWDYAADKRTIPFTPDAVAAELAKWVSGYADGYLTHVIPYCFR